MEDKETVALPPVWCIAANILRERPYGPGRQELRAGTKHFAPGAKVYLIEFFWGMGGESVTVVGRHRRSHRYLTLTIRSAWVVNWRVELVYSPFVIRAIQQHPSTYAPSQQLAQSTDTGWMGSPEAKAKAEAIIAGLQAWHPTAGRTEPFTTRSLQQDEPCE